MPISAKAAIIPSAGAPFEVDDIELEDLRPDEILVEVKAAGICHTDMIFAGGFEEGFKLPGVVGHEGAGVVVSVGTDVQSIAVGHHVVLTMRSCGACPSCAKGSPSYCYTMREHNMTGSRPDGSRAISWKGEKVSSSFFGQSSFATLAVAYEGNAVALPKDVPFHIAAPLACGVQTGMGAALRSFDLTEDQTVLVSGGGAVGMAAVMGAKLKGCEKIVVVEPNARRRDLAMQIGATHTIDPYSTPAVGEAVRQISPNGVDVVLECTGVPPAIEAAVSTLGPLGKIGFIGVTPPETEMPGFVMSLLAMGLTYKGVMMGDSDLGDGRFINELIGYWRDGNLPIEKIIRTYPFAEINTAIHDSHIGDAIKPVLTFA